MDRKLVAFFSATGTTAKAAEKLAAAAGADLYEIKPSKKYTKTDLNWLDKKSRSSVEMRNKISRPEIITGDIDLAAYDTVFLGFPIWWYTAPTVVNTFLETYDFIGKRIILFATSGGSRFGKTIEDLRPSAPGAELAEGRLLNGIITEKKLQELTALSEKG